MSFYDEIQALIRSQSPSNTALALELMQSQWEWSLEEGLQFLFLELWEAFGTKAQDQWSFSIGDLKIAFALEIDDEDPYEVFNWDLCLNLKLSSSKKVIHYSSRFIEALAHGDKSSDLRDLKREVELVFNRALAAICTALQTN